MNDPLAASSPDAVYRDQRVKDHSMHNLNKFSVRNSNDAPSSRSEVFFGTDEMICLCINKDFWLSY
jgi:hypothetical protein